METEPTPRVTRKSRSTTNVVTTVDLVGMETSTSQDPLVIQEDPDTSVVVGPKRRGRSAKTPKVKAPPKPKRLTLKQALAIVNAPIPKPTENAMSVALLSLPSQNVESPLAERSSTVDLTGDITFGKNHSKAPLFNKQLPVQAEPDGDDSEEDLDEIETIRVKVKFEQSIKVYPHRLHQKFYDLYKKIAEKENVSMGNLFLYDGDKRIHQDDTPHSADYKITSFLTCYVMEGVTNSLKQTLRKEEVELKFQSDKWKKPIVLRMSKMDNFKTAIEILCEQIEFKAHQISLYFDGDLISDNETPIDLDFEGGEIVDCRIKT